MKEKFLEDILETTPKEIYENFSRGIKKHYLSYPIKKSSGKLRYIDAPLGDLKNLQKNILQRILYKFKAHPSAVGFVTGVSAITGAERHLDAKVLLCMDLSNYFNSIKKHHVVKLWRYLLQSLEARGLVKYGTVLPPKRLGMPKPKTSKGAIVTHFNGKPMAIMDSWVNTLTSATIYGGRLPQGAPTSPALANLYTYTMDIRLSELAKSIGLTYTRYADDISFSHDDYSFDIATIIPDIIEIVSDYDLFVNKSKTRIMIPHRRMKVTGIVINDTLSVPRYKWRNFRAMLHNMKRDGIVPTEKEYQQLRGYAEWIRSLNPKRGENFLTTLGEIMSTSSLA